AARDHPAGPPVALKLLAPGPRTDPDRAVARLYREARRGTRLAHRALVPVEDWGRDGDVAFLAMPLVEGATLGELIARRRGPAPPAEPPPRRGARPDPAYYPALPRALARVARGLHAPPRAHVTHRDVKPENILVAPAGRAYLIDFGVARDLDVATDLQL